MGWTKLLTRLGCRGPEASELYTIADGLASLETLLNFPESEQLSLVAIRIPTIGLIENCFTIILA